MSDQSPPPGFAGKTAIVTGSGSGSGIGRATALRMSQQGATVIGSDVSSERLDSLAGELGGSAFVGVAGDISSEETAQRILLAANGRVDALANVAGIMDGFLPPLELTDEMWSRVLDVNLTAIMRLTRAVLPLMRASGHGSIVNVTSEAGLRGSAAGTAYTTSKHAVIGFTKSTALFNAHEGIRCNAVAPGPVTTNIEAPFTSEFAKQRLGPYMQVLVPPIATAGQLAEAIT